MAGMAHLGVGLAAKAVAPRTPLWALVTASYWIDIVFGVFYALGLERTPRGAAEVEEQAGGGGGQPTDPPAPWSHGLLMASVWSVVAGVAAWAISRRPRTGVLIALVAFSHWVVDVITQPMTAVFPRQDAIPLAFEGSRKVGLGLYRWKTAVTVCEYGSVAVGAAVYVLTLVRLRRARDGVD